MTLIRKQPKKKSRKIYFILYGMCVCVFVGEVNIEKNMKNNILKTYAALTKQYIFP